MSGVGELYVINSQVYASFLFGWNVVTLFITIGAKSHYYNAISILQPMDILNEMSKLKLFLSNTKNNIDIVKISDADIV